MVGNYQPGFVMSILLPTSRLTKAYQAYLIKSACEQGQRADLTGCTPEIGSRGSGKASSPSSKHGQSGQTYEEDMEIRERLGEAYPEWGDIVETSNGEVGVMRGSRGMGSFRVGVVLADGRTVWETRGLLKVVNRPTQQENEVLAARNDLEEVLTTFYRRYKAVCKKIPKKIRPASLESFETYLLSTIKKAADGTLVVGEDLVERYHKAKKIIDASSSTPTVKTNLPPSRLSESTKTYQTYQTKAAATTQTANASKQTEAQTTPKTDKPKFSGKKEDSLGRTHCFSEGVQVSCNNPDEPGEQPEDTTDITPEDKAQFDQEWDKVLQEQQQEIQASSVQDHDFSAEEMAAEQNWHAEFIEWRYGLLTGGRESDKYGDGQWDNNTRFEMQPTDASKVARFVSGLLNPLMGGVEYVGKLLNDWLGRGGKKADPKLVESLQSQFEQLSPDNEANGPAAELIASVVGEPAEKVLGAMGAEEGHRNRWVNTQLAKPKEPKKTQLAPDELAAAEGDPTKAKPKEVDEVSDAAPSQDATPEQKGEHYFSSLKDNLESWGITEEKHDERINFDELKDKVNRLVHAGLDHNDIVETIQKFADNARGVSQPADAKKKLKGKLRPSKFQRAEPTEEQKKTAGKANQPGKDSNLRGRVQKAKAKAQGAARKQAGMTKEEKEAEKEIQTSKSKQKAEKRRAKSAKYWARQYKEELRGLENDLKTAKASGDETEVGRLERTMERRLRSIKDEFTKEGYGEFDYTPKASKKSLDWYSTKDLTIHDPIKIHLPDLEQQKDWSCGACAMRIVCSYFGVGPEEEKDFRKLLGSSSSEGTHVARMVEFAKEQGLKVQAEEGLSVQDLQAALDDGKPVIVLLQAWGYPEEYPEDGSGHYAIVIGYDEENIYFEDPWIKGRRAKLRTAEFEQRWHDTGSDEKDTGHKFDHWGMICYKPQKIEYLKGLGRYLIKGEGTCEQGQRADLTGCTPASGETVQHQTSNSSPSKDDFLSLITPKVPPDTDEEIAAVREFKEAAVDWIHGMIKAEPGISDSKRKNMLNNFQLIIGGNATVAMIDRIRKNLGAMTLYETTKELSDHVRKLDKQFPANGECGGFFTWNAGERVGTLHLDGAFSDSNQITAGSIYAHELGHVIDGTGQTLSRDPDWHRAWKEEIDLQNDPLSRYARTDPAEGLAELFRLLLRGGYKGVRMDFPKCYQFLKSKGIV